MTSPEPVFWQARQMRRPSSSKGRPRRPSTYIDETGCVVTKGFVIPSRSSSIDSIAQSLASSTSATPPQTPGTPASPIEESSPGYTKPTGSLVTAPELNNLLASRHRASRSTSALTDALRSARPTLPGRRSTWEAQRFVSSRFDDDELAGTAFQPQTGITPRPAHEHAEFARSVEQRHRTTNMQDRLVSPPHHEVAKEQSAPNIKIVSHVEAEDAIDSDSDDDDMSDSDIDCKLAAQRKRSTYAERRARSDDMAQFRQDSPVNESQDAQVLFSAAPKPENAAETQSDVDELHGRGVIMERCGPIASSALSDNAIESEDEEDDPAVSARLDLARIHRSRNSMTASLPSTPTKLVLDEPRRPSALARVKLSMAAEDVTTPTEIRSFEADAPLAQRLLQPSKSQPQPMKGVLKKSGSQSSSERSSPSNKHVLTAVKRSSLQLPTGRARSSSPTVSTVHAAASINPASAA